MSGLTTNVAKQVKAMVGRWPDEPGQNELHELLRLVGRWRSLMLSNTYAQREGARIWAGPFAGMEYVTQATEGALAPRLLGAYEHELHPHLAAFAAEDLDCIIDIGCAEGYYAVGLARMMPNVTVYAHDISEPARRACTGLAAKNGVSDRVIVGGEFKPTDFEAYAGRKVLVMVDTEGAETDILQPDLSPALAGMSLIVETHDVFRPGTRATLKERFAPTHDIVEVWQDPDGYDMPPWMREFTHLDQLLAIWEWRVRPTPWLVMRPKAA